MDDSGLTLHFRKEMRKKLLLPVVLIILAIAVQSCTALTPDFVGMNQANMTLDKDSSSIAWGDYLYLYDTTPGESIFLYEWTVEWTDKDGIHRSEFVPSPNPVAFFGPFETKETPAIMVTEQVVTSAGISDPKIKIFHVNDGRQYIKNESALYSNRFNRSLQYPNGTLTFQDISTVLTEPPVNISNQWWRLTNYKTGELLGNWSGSDYVTVNLSRDDVTYLMNVTVKADTGFGSGPLLSYYVITPGSPDVAELSADFTTMVTGTNTVTFTDTSKGSPDSWFWQFGDGYTEIVQNPVHTYAKTGTYPVSLTITTDYSKKTNSTEKEVLVG